MLLEKNGRGSSSKRTRHINIRYFFVADRVANGEVKIEYCPTGDMLADYFTKPLQGSSFRKFRNEIMNISDDSAQITSLDRRSVLSKQLKPKSSTTGRNPTTSALRQPGPLVVKRSIANELRGTGRTAITSY
jgi:hypothetical protein